MIITKGGSNKARIKDLEPGTIFSLDSGTVCLMLSSYSSVRGEPVKQIVLLKGSYSVQGFCEDEEVTVHYGAELILR